MRTTILLGALALAACHPQPADNAADANASAAADAAQGQPMWIHATDKLNVKATYYQANNPKAIILLFHQADSSKDEYATIAPRLVKAGYSALAIDQRSGGTMFGTNETVTHLPKGWAAGMEDAQKDMEGAVQWAQPLGKPIILWGSSYSASLVIPLANAYPKTVKAALAFSPGEYFTDKHMIGRAAGWSEVPVYITDSGAPDEVAKAKAIAAKIPGGRATIYTPQHGVHGSSTLIAAKDPDGAEANWAPVMAFLQKVAP